jgi:rhodanese-related sulfurtransferase
MKRALWGVLGVLFLVTAFWTAPPARAAEEAPRISKEEVKSLLNNPAAIVLDARIATDWNASDKKIKGAVRIDPGDAGSWAGKIAKDKKIIVYCA